MQQNNFETPHSDVKNFIYYDILFVKIGNGSVNKHYLLQMNIPLRNISNDK